MPSTAKFWLCTLKWVAWAGMPRQEAIFEMYCGPHIIFLEMPPISMAVGSRLHKSFVAVLAGIIFLLPALPGHPAVDHVVWMGRRWQMSWLIQDNLRTAVSGFRAMRPLLMGRSRSCRPDNIVCRGLQRFLAGYLRALCPPS